MSPAKEERPTVPDKDVFDCPACRGPDGTSRGFVIAEPPGGPQPQSCDVCWGRKVVDRASLERYEARTLAPPPPRLGR